MDTAVEPVAVGDGARVALVRRDAPASAWPYSVPAELGERFTAELHPYYRWANRGPATMRIWTPAL